MAGEPPTTIRVAIIGSGLTGLVATYLLTSQLEALPTPTHHPATATGPSTSPPPSKRIVVEIFERSPTLGMDSASISVPLNSYDLRSESKSDQPLQHSPERNGRIDRRKGTLRIDVPMRAFTGGYYPELLALYQHLGVRISPSNFTYSFAKLPSPPTSSPASCQQSSPPPPPSSSSSSSSAPSPFLLYNGASGLRGVSLPSSLRRRASSKRQHQHQHALPIPLPDGKPGKSAPPTAPGSSPSPPIAVAVLEALSKAKSRATVTCRYLFQVLATMLGYVQLLAIALFHHRLGHTSDPTHPIYTMTLHQLILDPFPSRPPTTASSPWSTLTSLLLLPYTLLLLPLLRACIRLDAAFVLSTVVPLFSAVMTCSAESVLVSPATEVLDYVALTFGKNHYVVNDGVRDVVQKLLANLDDAVQDEAADEVGVDESAPPTSQTPQSRIWTSSEVSKVEHRNGQIYLTVRHLATPRGSARASASASSGGSSSSSDFDEADSDSVASPAGKQAGSARTRSAASSDTASSTTEHGGFDHLILATQANQGAKFLSQYVESLRSSASIQGSAGTAAEVHRLQTVLTKLRSFKYEPSLVINHTDERLLPSSRRDWRDLNLVSPTATPATASATHHGGMPATHTMATHVIRPRSAPRTPILQTTNPHPTLRPHAASVLSTSYFERVTLDLGGKAARVGLFDHCAATGRVRLGALQGGKPRVPGVYCAGSWATGIPLLEGCVVSARLVAVALLRDEGVAVRGGVPWLEGEGRVA